MSQEIKSSFNEEIANPFLGDQLIQKEEREAGDNGLKPYVKYLRHGKGFLYSSLAVLAHILFLLGQSIQSYWLATNVQNSSVSELKLVIVYSVIGCSVTLFLFVRSFSIVSLGLEASRSIFSTLLRSLLRAPMSFFDATPVGRILSRVSSDISIIDLDIAMMINMALASALTAFFSFGILAFVTWQVLLVIVPMVYLTILLQRYYFASAKELMRINGTTKSTVASNLAEAISGATTIRAFGKEDQYFSKAVELIDKNASPFFHSVSTNEWLIQRLEMLCAVILSCSALALTLLPFSESNSGFVGMALSYGLSLNVYFASSVQNQCMLANMMISAERLEQYMYISEEANEIIPENRPPATWPDVGKIEISDLKVKYRPNGPLVLQGISCIFEGGNKIDNNTDVILQRTIRTEFAGCTVVTVAHRIPTVMDCTKVLAVSDGKVADLMNQKSSLTMRHHYSGNLLENTGHMLIIPVCTQPWLSEASR